jgi:pimeloyl-ACP methyl ester carboxylesterase
LSIEYSAFLLNASLLFTSRGTFALRDSGGSGPPVVLLHGWPESSACWEPVLPYLPAGDFRYLRPDLRGLGDSERTPGLSPYQKDELARDLLSLLDALGLDTALLVGHDWGGIVAQEAALLAPHRVRGLALLAINVLPNGEGNAKARQTLRGAAGRSLWYQTFQQLPHLAEAMIPGNEEVWLRTFLRFADGRPFPAEQLAEYVRTFRIPETPRTSASYYRTMKTDLPRWQALAGRNFGMPGLVLHGTADPVIVPEYFAGAEACFSSFHRIPLDGAGHFLTEERPEAVGRALAGWLGEQ